MPLAVDVVSSVVATASPVSWSHAGAATPSNYLAVVGFAGFRSGSFSVSSITYGGQAMTLIKQQNYTGGANEQVYLYGLINPPAGTQTIVVTLNAITDFLGGAITFTGADQATGWHNATSTTTGTATTASLVVTSAAGEMTTTIALVDNGTAVLSTNQTIQFLPTPTGIAAGGDTAAGSATVTHTWTSNISTDGQWAIAGASIQAAPPQTGLQSSHIVPIITVQNW